MRLFVAVTDNDWFSLHARRPGVEEVNFWRPSSDSTFKVLQPGKSYFLSYTRPSTSLWVAVFLPDSSSFR